ncbi:MAG: YeeE/YedE family protein [Deltaproteobacteria bacterium]|nr:YeeE/YedE family protein [Deltaproteobacteria bacterium]
MAQILAALASGLVFGAGLALAGMTNPAKVLSFLDLAGAWDPTLALVMGGALAVNAAAYAVTRRRAKPLYADAFALPTRSDLDARLLGGAALFGLGWALVGLCPGPALASLARGDVHVLGFVAAMAVGMLAARRV